MTNGAATPVEDGIVFDTDAASAEIIRDNDECSGVRVRLIATLITATRWRDFADLYLLTGRRRVDGAELHQSLAGIAAYRDAEPSPLATALVG